jgi:DnaA-homolog protein
VAFDETGQLTLAIDRAHEQTLSTFVQGPNEEIVSIMTQPRPGFRGIWLCGNQGSGKTHLLRAMTLLGKGIEQRQFVDTKSPRVLADLESASRRGEVIAVDDASEIAHQSGCEEALMATYERLNASNGLLIVGDRLAATATDFSIADLNSRVRSLMHYQMMPLLDEEKSEILRARALHRGYELNDSVLSYWLARGPRDLRLLLTDLDRLDRASLAHQRHVTIPLLKEVLGY